MNKASQASLLQSWLRPTRRLLRSKSTQETIHFLHIGKNAGTEIGRWITALNEVQNEIHFHKRGHRIKLADIPRSNKYFFSIRNPLERFVSGFLSRQRKGQPRNDLPWTRHERIAFEYFSTPNQLAEALFENSIDGNRAFSAMKSIFHVAWDQVDWFLGQGNFLEVRPPIAILRQHSLEEDMLALLMTMGLDSVRVPIGSEIESHRNPSSQDSDLSQKAIDNLSRWYSQDLEFYRVCNEWIKLNENPRDAN